MAYGSYRDGIMEVTVSAIKADIGSIAGHTKPTPEVIAAVEKVVQQAQGSTLIDYYIGHCGDDIHILMTHTKGIGASEVHQLAWNAFVTGTAVAKEQGLYGAGQDLLKDAFSGNVRGLGPGVAEMTITERQSEVIILFVADKTEPGAYNLPFYKMFTDPDFNSGLLLKPSIQKGYTFTVMDVDHIAGDKVIELNSPEEVYKLATLLRDNNRFVVEKVHSRHNGDIVAASSTSRLHNIAGKYVGKDDPVALVRAQQDFPATEEVCKVFRIAHYVTGNTRGSHTMPLMPVVRNSAASSYFCIPLVSALGFQVKNGKLTGPIDLFDDPYWETIRTKACLKADLMREQGWSGAAMASKTELAYTAIQDTMEELEKRFVVRK